MSLGTETKTLDVHGERVKVNLYDNKIELSQHPCYSGFVSADISTFSPDIHDKPGLYLQFVEGCGYDVKTLTLGEAETLGHFLISAVKRTREAYGHLAAPEATQLDERLNGLYHVCRVAFVSGQDNVPWNMFLHGVREALNFKGTYRLQEKDYKDHPILTEFMALLKGVVSLQRVDEAKKTKPAFEQLTSAFQAYLRRMMHCNMPKISDPDAWQKKCDENKGLLKEELTRLGLADCIDWDETPTKPK